MDPVGSARLDQGTATLLPRSVWLIVAPTACAFGPWIGEAVTSGPVSTKTSVTEACAPLVGALAVVVYRFASSHPVRLWPFLPYFAASAYFGASLIEMATGVELGTGTSGDAAIPVLTVLCLAAQPFLALAGGVLSFIAVGRRAGGLVE